MCVPMSVSVDFHRVQKWVDLLGLELQAIAICLTRVLGTELRFGVICNRGKRS